MLAERLEDRRLLSSGPIILATFNQSIGSKVVVDAAGDLFGTVSSSGDSAGSIFEIPAGAGSVKTLASFGFNNSSNTLGINPGDILIDSAGNLYGDTQLGGPNASPGDEVTPASGGTIWKLPVGSNTIQVVATLTAQATSDLTRDLAGDLFVYNTNYNLNEFGGDDVIRSSATGQVQELAFDGSFFADYPILTGATCDPAGNALIMRVDEFGGPGYLIKVPAGRTPDSGKLVYTFNGASDNAPLGISTDSASDVYVTTADYTEMPDGTHPTTSSLLELKANSKKATVLSVLDETADGYSFVGNPVIDSAGDVFAVTSQGGEYGFGTLVELPVGQSQFKVLVSFSGSSGAAQAAGLTVNSQGTVLGTLPYGNATAVYEWPGVGTAVGIRQAIAQTKLPSKIVGGVHFSGAIHVVLPAAAGIATVTLYAAADGATITLGQIAQKYRSGVASLAETFGISTALPAGSYTLMIKTTDADGNAITWSLGKSLKVAAAFTRVTASVASISPKVQPGQMAAVIFSIANTGNITAENPLAITLALPGQFILLKQTIALSLRAKRTIRTRLRFTVPTTAIAGSYEPVISAVEDDLTTQTTSTKSLRIV